MRNSHIKTLLGLFVTLSLVVSFLWLSPVMASNCDGDTETVRAFGDSICGMAYDSGTMSSASCPEVEWNAYQRCGSITMFTTLDCDPASGTRTGTHWDYNAPGAWWTTQTGYAYECTNSVTNQITVSQTDLGGTSGSSWSCTRKYFGGCSCGGSAATTPVSHPISDASGGCLP